MAVRHKVVFLLMLPLLFLVADAKPKPKNVDPEPHVPQPVPQNPNPLPVSDGNQAANPDFETQFAGKWEYVNPDAGVSAMHAQLLHNNRIYLYDCTVYRISRLKLPIPIEECLPFPDPVLGPQRDCWAHAVEYDVESNKVVRPIKIVNDPWCSSGGVAPDGTLVSTGGFLGGTRSIRYMPTCPNCPFREYQAPLKEGRWYATQVILPNGAFILMGGRRAFSYEYVPPEGLDSPKTYFFPFLYETSDLDENNLYPFVHLSIDGNLFIFANNRSLLLNPNTNKIVRIYPLLPGGSRNYPASGMSALLPLHLNSSGEGVSAEVIICGGNSPDAFRLSDIPPRKFLPALRDCARMVITDRLPTWDVEMMPSRRIMSDLLNLPDGKLLLINGAMNGTSGWWDADVPNFTPVLYTPTDPKGKRFKNLAPSLIARMYHSTSAVLPSGKIWVSGSNPHNTYKFPDIFPTETSVENFSPPYLDPALTPFRPLIQEATSFPVLKYKVQFDTRFTLQQTGGNAPLSPNDIKVVMYLPPFTTHGYSMNQRLLVLPPGVLTPEIFGVYKITSLAPASGNVAPPGYYMLYVVHRGVPSRAMWVHIS